MLHGVGRKLRAHHCISEPGPQGRHGTKDSRSLSLEQWGQGVDSVDSVCPSWLLRFIPTLARPAQAAGVELPLQRQKLQEQEPRGVSG